MYDAFLAAILAEPDDDTPRLVCADWLDENGDADRAEFIRVQCELARLPEDEDRAADLQDRERHLLAAHRERWERPLRGREGLGLFECRFRRGFVEGVKLPARQFLAHMADFYRFAPVREARLTDLALRVEAVAGSALLAPLRALDLSAAGVFGSVEVLARSRHLDRLTALNLSSNRLRGADIQALARGRALAGLATLNLSANSHLGRDGLAELARAPCLDQLTDLNLSATGAEAEGLARLRGAALERLDLSFNPLGPGAAAALGPVGQFPRLTRLLANHCHLRPAGLHLLLGAPFLKRMTHLELGGNSLTAIGVGALAGCSNLSRLTVLRLRRNRARPAGCRALASTTFLSRLAVLELDENEVGDAGAEALAESPHLAGLRVLSLRANRIGDGGARALAKASSLAGLRSLDLTGNAIGDVGARALAAAAFGRLRVLGLRANRIGLTGALALARAPWLERIHALDLSRNPLGEPARDILGARLGSRLRS